MLSKENIKYLKKYSLENEIFKINIGKNVVNNEKIVENLKNSFNTRELIKLCFLKNSLENNESNCKEENVAYLQKILGFEVVYKIGNTFLIYKENKDLKNHIKLS